MPEDKFPNIPSSPEEDRPSLPEDLMGEPTQPIDTAQLRSALEQQLQEQPEAEEEDEAYPPTFGDKLMHALSKVFRPRTRPRSFMLSVVMTTLKFSLVLALLCGVALFGVVLGTAKAYLSSTPDLDLASIEDQDETSFFYDVNGELITTFSSLEHRIWAEYEEIPEAMIHAIVSVEDERFFEHNGVDYKRIAGAFFHNLTSSSTQGGSTITQQVIKLCVLSSDQTYKRKIQEAYLAMQLEEEYEKEEILEAYLNIISMGESNYGIKAAAEDYFDKELSELTIRECAMLAGIAKSPYLYNPRRNIYGSGTPDLTIDRTDTVLNLMYENGYISEEEYLLALEEEVHIEETGTATDMYDMPYFVEYAMYDVVTHFLREEGLEDNSTNRSRMENRLRTGGYHIYLTVDPEVQKAAENEVYTYDNWPRLGRGASSVISYTNADGSITEIVQPQASVVMLDYRNGHLEAMVGGRTEPTVRKGTNRTHMSHMPVGSSMKPIAVYGPAIDLGYSGGTVMYDIPMAIPGWNAGAGYPRNSGGSFSGPVTIREAIKRSLNVISAQTLMHLVGVETSYEYLISMGVTSTLSKDGSGLALGTNGITMLEEAACFGTLANGGKYVEPVSFTHIEDSSGNVVLRAEDHQIVRQVFKPSTSWMITDLLVGAVQGGTGSNARISGMTVAGKTGTNSDYRGVTFAGYTPYYACAVWVGHDNYEPLVSGASGGRYAAPLWQNVMEKVHKMQDLTNRSIQDISRSEAGVVSATVCSFSGLRPAEGCPTVTDYFASDSVPRETCDIHQPVELCKETGKICTEWCPEAEEDTTEEGQAHYILNLPEDHMLQKASKETLKQYLGAVDLDPEKDMCPIHTEAWYQSTLLPSPTPAPVPTPAIP